MKTSVRYSSALIGAALASTAIADCPAPGTFDSKGRYSCNPAHQYPDYQICQVFDGCPFLSKDGKAITITTTVPLPPLPTSACLPPGAFDFQGRYSCNPAHQYPSGQGCQVIDGCYFLSKDGKAVIATPSVSVPLPTGVCLPPGTFDSQGRYSCNPAHEYPKGEVCQIIDGCPLLVKDGKPATPTSITGPAPTSACPAPGTYDNKGRYSCNPAHQYPSGQVCVIIDGCPFLTKDGKPVGTSVAPSPPQSTCPPAGSRDVKGRYSCNPAHQYPSGQSCIAVDGCYVLTPGSSANTTAVEPAPTGVPVSGTSTTQVSGMLAILALAMTLVL